MQQLDFISQFTTDIRHIGGHGNAVADAVSHLEANVVQLRPQLISKAQASDTDLHTLQTSNNSIKLLKYLCPCAMTLCCVILPQEHLDLMCQKISDVWFLTHCIVYLIQE